MGEIKQGKSVLRWRPAAQGGFEGRVILGQKMSPVIHDDDEQHIVARLRNEAGRLHPDYFGFDGALRRFLQFKPDGLKGDQGPMAEREYKLRAAAAINDTLPLTAAMAANAADAIRLAGNSKCWINLLSPYEAMRMKDALKGSGGAAFLKAAALFASGDWAQGGNQMTAAIKAHGTMTWPIATYLPFLWDCTNHMFLKPTVTVDFAQRVGHKFQEDYDPAINAETYESLLDLVAVTRQEIATLDPRDNIDIQSFIWVVGAYKDDDKP
jgi:hypothetical protein